jgi:anti-anti-sigma regulatory factor
MKQDSGGFSFGERLDFPSIIISGPFDFMDPKIDAWVDERLDRGDTALLLDLGAAHYLTAAGIACMFKIVKKIGGAGGLLHIAGATGDMIELITLGKMDRYVSYIVD